LDRVPRPFGDAPTDKNRFLPDEDNNMQTKWLPLLISLMTTPALSQTPIKVGVLTDMSGAYSDSAAMGSVEAVKMAFEEFGGTVDGHKLEVLYADHQNKPDVGSAIARQWFDVENVNVIVDMPNSAIALAAMELAKSRNRLIFATGAGAPDISQEQCNPMTLQWTFDTYQMAASLVRPVIERGGTKWFEIMPNYIFGTMLGRDIGDQVTKLGGQVVGVARPPLDSTEFSNYLLQAQQSGATVLGQGFANTAGVTILKQAAEFGLTKSMTVAAVSLLDNDVRAVGLDAAQGYVTSVAWVPDRSPAAVTWSAAFKKRYGRTPSFTQAGTYSAVRHYLAAIKAIGSTEPAPVLAEMRKTPVNDMFATNGHIRADGIMVHDWYLRQVKTPAQSKGPDDLFNLLATIPGDQVVRPLSESKCPLVTHPNG
jgi:branched-chain amino acid transport system substrate-binding protein